MPQYYVYNVDTGEIVHRHETYDATSGTSLRCTRDEVLALVDETHQKDKLEILETELEPRSGSRPEAEILRVDPKTRTLISG
jgi:hypothetical protein